MNIKIKNTTNLPVDMRGEWAEFLYFHRLITRGEDVVVVQLGYGGKRWIAIEHIEEMPDELRDEIMLRKLK